MKRDIKELMAVSTISAVLEYVIMQEYALDESLLQRTEKAIEGYDDSNEDFSSKEYLVDVLIAMCEVLEAKNV